MPNSLDDDIRATVDRAISSGHLLHIPEVSKRLADAHPESGLAAPEIAQIVLEAGISARVSLEWGGEGDYEGAAGARHARQPPARRRRSR